MCRNGEYEACLLCAEMVSMRRACYVSKWLGIRRAWLHVLQTMCACAIFLGYVESVLLQQHAL